MRITRRHALLRWLALCALSVATPLVAQQEGRPVAYVAPFASVGVRGVVPDFGASVLDELESRLEAEGVYRFARWDSIVAKLPSTMALSTQQQISGGGSCVLGRQLVNYLYPGHVLVVICGGLEELADRTHRLTGYLYTSDARDAEVGPFVVATPAEAADRLTDVINSVPRQSGGSRPTPAGGDVTR